MTDNDLVSTKQCTNCRQHKPISEFRRRTGKRSKGQSRRGTCQRCRKLRVVQELTTLSLNHRSQPAPVTSLPTAGSVTQHALPAHPIERRSLAATSLGAQPKRSTQGAGQRQSHSRGKGQKPSLNPEDPALLIPSSKGMILMRGHSDKGRRWHQEIDLALAVTLVKEHAAVVVNRRTIRRIYSNKDFRTFILTRDNYTCYFCGLYGDTIDHLLPRAKGGHTTPDNCVCACNLCNQTKADQYVEEFMGR